MASGPKLTFGLSGLMLIVAVTALVLPGVIRDWRYQSLRNSKPDSNLLTSETSGLLSRLATIAASPPQGIDAHLWSATCMSLFDERLVHPIAKQGYEMTDVPYETNEFDALVSINKFIDRTIRERQPDLDFLVHLRKEIVKDLDLTQRRELAVAKGHPQGCDAAFADVLERLRDRRGAP